MKSGPISLQGTDGTGFLLPPGGCNYNKGEDSYTPLCHQLRIPLVTVEKKEWGHLPVVSLLYVLFALTCLS